MRKSSAQAIMERRAFLKGLGVLSTLPFLQSLAVPGIAEAACAPNRLKRLIVVAQPHMAAGSHRIPEFVNTTWGRAATLSRIQTDTANALRFAAFGTDPAGLGPIYGSGLLGTDPRLQRELMVINGLACTYNRVYGHLSNADGRANFNNQDVPLDRNARFPLSGAVHEPWITLDQVIARTIHRPNQRILSMGALSYDTSVATDESVDANGARPGFVRSPNDIFRGSVFDNGNTVTAARATLSNTSGGTSGAVDAKAALSVRDFSILEGLEASMARRNQILADTGLSTSDRQILDSHFDMVNENLTNARNALSSVTVAPNGCWSVSPQCANPTLGSANLTGYLPILGSAFLCDLTRVVLMNVWPRDRVSENSSDTANGLEHQNWHNGASGEASQAYLYNELPRVMGRVAQFLAGLVDPTTGRDMLETTLILGVTNHGVSVSYPGLGGDRTHYFSEVSYLSIGGSAALNTGMMYDAMAHLSTGNRGPVSGGIYTMNQALQTYAAAFGLTPTQWAGKSGNGFGPWLSSVNYNKPIRVDDAAKRSPIPRILKA